jgi:chemotaxis protein MotB
MAKKKEAEKENGERWMLTYLDMITLLFVTFVVLYAMSNVDKAKYEAVAQSLAAAMGSPSTEVGNGTGAGPGVIVSDKVTLNPAVPVQTRKARAKLYDKAYDILRSEIQAKRIDVRQEERGLIIQLGAQVFFEIGSADLPAGTMNEFLPVAKMISSIPNRIIVEGYADDVTLESGSAFRDNWDLSAQRAITVLNLLQDLGVDPTRMNVAGYGASHPLVSNDTPEGRAYNRQVNIVIPYSADEI